MQIKVKDERGELVLFEVPDSMESRWTCSAILEGATYPDVPFIGDVETIWDAGANCGAATTVFARRYPDALVHSFEPGAEALGYLRQNTAELRNVVVHPVGLSDTDAETTLYRPADDLGRSTTIRPVDPSQFTEQVVRIRSAAAVATEMELTHIDVLKVDVEGCEVAVLESLEPWLAGIKVIYVEYDSRNDRRKVDRLLEQTHELYFAAVSLLDQGEILYLRKDLADHPGAVPRLRELVFGGAA